MPSTELDELIVADADALRAWLTDHHATSPGVWLALTRKGGTVTTLTWQQAVDEALCFGWIDGQARKGDQEMSWIRFTPRRPRSAWSRRNVEHVARLESAGRMTPSGRAVVEAAKADGRWA
ncbi:YdeI family protein, partial [Micromonospora zhanjiangensis]